MQRPILRSLLCTLIACTITSSATAADIWWAETSLAREGWPAAGRIAYAPLAGGGAVTTYQEEPGRPGSVAVDGTTIAWGTSSAAPNTISVWNVAKSGSAVTAWSSTLVASFGPRAMDTAAGKIYTGVRPGFGASGGLVQVANLDGSGSPVTLYDRGANSVGPTEAEVAGNRLYWCEFVGGDSTTGAVMRGSLDGSEPATALFSNEYGCNGLAVDAVNGKVYWTRFQTDASSTSPSLIRVGNLDGSGSASTLYDEGPNSSSGLALDVPTGKLYWANQPTGLEPPPGSGSIRVGQISGAPAADLYSGLNNPNAVALAGTGTSPTPTPAAAGKVDARVLTPRTRLVAGQTTLVGVRARNTGTGPATGVVACLRLPVNMVVVRTGGARKLGRTWCFQQGTIAPGAQKTGTVTVRVIARRTASRVTASVRADGQPVQISSSRAISVAPRNRPVPVTG
jgi:hypothetical protein